MMLSFCGKPLPYGRGSYRSWKREGATAGKAPNQPVRELVFLQEGLHAVALRGLPGDAQVDALQRLRQIVGAPAYWSTRGPKNDCNSRLDGASQNDPPEKGRKEPTSLPKTLGWSFMISSKCSLMNWNGICRVSG